MGEQVQEKTFIVKASALQVLLESFDMAHGGTTKEVISQFVQSGITENKEEEKEDDDK